jgi:phosphoketolase
VLAEELRLLDAYWRAANYLSVGQIYLLDNPLLREPLRPEHVKPLLGSSACVCDPGSRRLRADGAGLIRAAPSAGFSGHCGLPGKAGS